MQLISKHCKKCGNKHTSKNPLTRHHVEPKCHFHGSGERVTFCRRCHTEMERFIKKHEGTNLDGTRCKRNVRFYLDCLNHFLSSNCTNQ